MTTGKKHACHVKWEKRKKGNAMNTRRKKKMMRATCKLVTLPVIQKKKTTSNLLL